MFEYLKRTISVEKIKTDNFYLRRTLNTPDLN